VSKVSTIGLDLAKNVFQVHGADVAGAVVFRKRLRGLVFCNFSRCSPTVRLRWRLVRDRTMGP
jgi:transposase